MARKNFNDVFSKNFQTKSVSEPETSLIDTGENGKPELINFNQIKKNPLNTGNDKDPEIIESLKISIDVMGLLEPPIVYKDDDNFYMLISGEGRWMAIKELKKEKDCFDKILCIVRRKPVSTDEEKIWIDSANEQRNTPNIERTRKNIRAICQHAKNMADSGYGQFNEIIKGMSLLKRSSVFNYMKINERLSDSLMKLFDDEMISVRDALLYCNYSKKEQESIFKKYHEEGKKFKVSKEEIDLFLQDENSRKSASYKLEIETLRKALQEKEREYDDLHQSILQMPSSGRKRKKELSDSIIKAKEEEIDLLKEKLLRMEQRQPVFSEEDIRKQKEEQEIMNALSQIAGQMARVEKLSNHYEKAYGFLTDSMKEQWNQLLAISLTMGKREEKPKNE